MAIEDQVRDFYENEGWHADTTGSDEVYGDAAALGGPCARARPSTSRRAAARCSSSSRQSGERILDAGSGPIQYPEYLEYSSGFTKRVCVDLSQRALDEARNKLGDRGDYVRASLLELPFPDDHFDAAVSLHTIYHVDSDQQEGAVRELMRVLKPGASAVVVYANPDRLAARLKRLARRRSHPATGAIYFFAHPLSWWKRFSDEAVVEIVPWRTLNANESKRLIPDDAFGVRVFRALCSRSSGPSLAWRRGLAAIR